MLSAALQGDLDIDIISAGVFHVVTFEHVELAVISVGDCWQSKLEGARTGRDAGSQEKVILAA